MKQQYQIDKQRAVPEGIKRSVTAVFVSSTPVSIVRQAGTPEEKRWSAQLGGDFVQHVLAHDRLMRGDELHCELFDEPRVVTRVDPILAGCGVSYWKAKIVPLSAWRRERSIEASNRPNLVPISASTKADSLTSIAPLSTAANADDRGGRGGRNTQVLNVARIKSWMTHEGWTNEELAQKLNISERAVSSIRNNGEYHGIDAVTKLANLMDCAPEELYSPPEAST